MGHGWGSRAAGCMHGLPQQRLRRRRRTPSAAADMSTVAVDTPPGMRGGKFPVAAVAGFGLSGCLHRAMPRFFIAMQAVCACVCYYAECKNSCTDVTAVYPASPAANDAAAGRVILTFVVGIWPSIYCSTWYSLPLMVYLPHVLDQTDIAASSAVHWHPPLLLLATSLCNSAWPLQFRP